MADSTTARILLTGAVADPAFPGWILRHGRKLGLHDITACPVAAGLEVQATGARPMLHALALGASLGPAGVLVDTMTITTATCDGATA